MGRKKDSGNPLGPSVKGHYVYFPESAGKWSVYPKNKALIKVNKIDEINPRGFGYLTYQVLKDWGNGMYEIQTEAFGCVKIYCVPRTEAKVN